MADFHEHARLTSDFFHHERVLTSEINRAWDNRDDRTMYDIALSLAGDLTPQNYNDIGKKLLMALALHDNLVGGKTVMMVCDMVNF